MHFSLTKYTYSTIIWITSNNSNNSKQINKVKLKVQVVVKKHRWYFLVAVSNYVKNVASCYFSFIFIYIFHFYHFTFPVLLVFKSVFLSLSECSWPVPELFGATAPFLLSQDGMILDCPCIWLAARCAKQIQIPPLSAWILRRTERKECFGLRYWIGKTTFFFSISNPEILNIIAPIMSQT